MFDFNKQPAILVGIVLAIVVGAIEQFVGGGIITTDSGESATNIANAAAPLVVGIITRSLVFSPSTVTAILLALGRKESEAGALADKGKSIDPTL